MRSQLTRLALSALAAATLGGCAAALETAGGGDFVVDPVRGQTVLFVGTDATTLRTNIYQVQAVNTDDFATDEERNAAVLVAESFEVTVLTDFEAETDPLVDDGATLLPSEAPFAVPDYLGNRVAVVATGVDFETEISYGRAAVIDLQTREQRIAPELPGLVGARFTWLGNHLLLESRDSETGTASVATLDLLDPSSQPIPVELEGATSVVVAGLLPESDAFLAVVQDDDGGSSVVALDPLTGAGDTLVSASEGGLGQLTVSPDGLSLAATHSAPDSGRRSVVVADLSAAPTEWVFMTAHLDAECHDPAWNPARVDGLDAQLAYACEQVTTGRPDLFLWEGSTLPDGDSPPSMETLTEGGQPAVPGSSMDGLVLRSRLRWDPSGSVLLFGASSSEDADLDEAMSLLVLDPLEGRAVPVYDGDDGNADLAHFAAASSEPVLLVWDRNASGLEDSVWRHTIQLVAASPSGSRTVRGVNLGRDLLVSYPLFLAGNTLLYP